MEIKEKLFVIFFFSSIFLAHILNNSIERKLKIAQATLQFLTVNEQEISFETITASAEFEHLSEHLKQLGQPGAIIFLNKNIVNITFNWLCNSKYYNGVHNRVIAVTMDSGAKEILSKYWPQIVQFHWPINAIHSVVPIRQVVPYILLFRANLARALVSEGLSFWMMQADTIWRENFFLHESKLFSQPFDIIFDVNGHDGYDFAKKYICGGNWLVNPTEKSRVFLNSLSERMNSWYVPDSSIATYQCQLSDPIEINCQYLSFRLTASWTWLMGNLTNPPVILQIDSQLQTAKLDFIRQIGFDFVSLDDRVSCNKTAVENVKDIFEKGSFKSQSLLTPEQRYIMLLDFILLPIYKLFPTWRLYLHMLYYFIED